MRNTSNKSIFAYISIGVLIGLVLAYIGYSFTQTKDLKSTVETQQEKIATLEKESDSILNKQSSTISESQVQEETAASNESPSTVTDSQSNISEWSTVIEQHNFEGYLAFIKKHGSTHPKYDQAIHSLNQLGTRGWLYAGRTSDQTAYIEDQIVQTIWRPNSNNDVTKAVQQVGDIVRLISPTARRTYSNFTPRIEQNGVWQKEKEGYVFGVEIEGRTVVIIQVIYN